MQQIAQSWYLFPSLLAAVDPAAYPDAASYLAALTAPARAQNKDKGWSFVTTAQASQRYYGDGEAIGFGLQVLFRTDSLGTRRLWVAQAIPASAAWDAGFRRGDEILQIGETETTLVPLADILAAHSGSLGDALGPPSTEGVTRSFEVMPNGGAAAVVRTATTRIYSLSPVEHYVILRTPAPPAGVIVLRTFVSTADAELRNAIADFVTAGVTDVIVDVRYNGGGLVSTARLLANQLAAGRVGSVMYTMQFNDAHQDQNGVQYFSTPTGGAIAPVRVAFVTTGSSASASELVPNVLEPYLGANVAIVGKRTYGKPVGQSGFTIPLCNDLLYLVSFRLPNAQGDADYYQGLPDTAVPPQFSGPFCDADDDLTHDMGDAAESSTAAALYWLANGTCQPAPAATRLPSADAFPVPDRPSIAQREIPGLL